MTKHRLTVPSRLPPMVHATLEVPPRSNRTWLLDFMSDALYHGRAFHTLNIIDDFAREALAIEIDTTIPAVRVIRMLENLPR